jgi:hypothetical protein
MARTNTDKDLVYDTVIPDMICDDEPMTINMLLDYLINMPDSIEWDPYSAAQSALLFRLIDAGARALTRGKKANGTEDDPFGLAAEAIRVCMG